MGYEKGDNLIGIKDASNVAFLNAVQQRCVVHLKEFCNNLKIIYKPNTEKEAKENLERVKKKWSKIYPTSLEYGKTIGKQYVLCLIILRN